jgi:hypothetical protein
MFNIKKDPFLSTINVKNDMCLTADVHDCGIGGDALEEAVYSRETPVVNFHRVFLRDDEDVDQPK